jgi:DNA-binding NarL/FixJ family response regulator
MRPVAAASQAVDAPVTVALIAKEGPREHIGEILKENQLTFTTFSGAENLLGCCAEDPPELVVLWVEDAVPSPARQLERLQQELKPAQVVVVCPGIQRWEIRAALAAGVAGVVLEEKMGDTLGPCLHAVRSGQICVPREHWRQIEPPTLSTREKQILGLVVMGYMNSQIAERLFLAESTVKSHLSSAFGKLGVRSRNEAVSLILDSQRGLGMGILGLGGEPLERTSASARIIPQPTTAHH